MNKMQDIINQAEGRRLEFKAKLPEHADLARSIVAFANDAGGDLFIGIADEPRSFVGVDEDELMSTEEKISNIIFDRCYPAILPDIKFLTVEGKHLIQVTVYRGSTPPYYLKEHGKLNGTYIRVGSSNRLADESIIAELERRKRNISFDAEPVLEKRADELDISGFEKSFKDLTQESLEPQTLRKLGLVKEIHGVEYPTNALILLSDDELRHSMFHFAKVECARFKGTTTDIFIDRKSITSNIVDQVDEAYRFVLRNINEGATVEGVYTIGRWEYPIKAIREVLRNAIVHRDYSLTGKDVKVAIYDDMVEITSPGLLPPSIDYAAMQSRQSDARNKIIAPIFKHLGLIDQWGNGLRLIAAELASYPEIEMIWRDVGLSFQIQFVKTNFIPTFKYDVDDDVGDNSLYVGDNVGIYGSNVGDNTPDVGGDVGINEPEVGDNTPNVGDNSSDVGGHVGINDTDVGDDIRTCDKVLQLISQDERISASLISSQLGITTRQCERIIAKLKAQGKLLRHGNAKSGHWEVVA